MRAGTSGKQGATAATSSITTVDGHVLKSLAARLERAVDTLQRLPAAASSLPAGTRSAWPDMIRRSRFAIERTKGAGRAVPSAEAIDDLDRFAMLFWDLTPRQRQLLWARACRAEPRAQPARPAPPVVTPPSRRTGCRSAPRSSACLSRHGDGATPTTSPFLPSEAAHISLNVCML